MRTCAQCHEPLASDSHPRRRYCSDRCKLAAHRDPTVRLADDALDLLKPVVVLAGGVMDPGIGWRDRLDFLKLHYPVILRTFGEDVLQATAQPLPAGTCRWCWSWALAVPGNRRKLLAKAMTTPGAKRLLGTPCKVCTGRVLKMMDARMRTGRSAAATGTGSASVERMRGSAGGNGTRTASHKSTAAAPRPPTQRHLHDPFGNCKVCLEWYKTHPGSTALTASELPAGCPPHAWNEPPRRGRYG
jgi:hypothetical protein